MLVYFFAALEFFLLLYLGINWWLGGLNSTGIQLNTFYTGLAMATCCIYYKLSQLSRAQDTPNNKVSALPAIILTSCLLAYSWVGLNFHGNYALVIGGAQPRVENSLIFFRLPWESYTLHHDNPRGTESIIKASYPVIVPDAAGKTITFNAKMKFKFAWTDENLDGNSQGLARNEFFSICTNKAVITAHKEMGRFTLNSEEYWREFSDIITREIKKNLAGSGFQLEKFEIQEYEVHLKEEKRPEAV